MNSNFRAENVHFLDGPPNEVGKQTKSEEYSMPARWSLVLAAKEKHRGTESGKRFEITVGFHQ